jgi:two-component system cell cycle sensor histidine kinase/response regulator CckA
MDSTLGIRQQPMSSGLSPTLGDRGPAAHGLLDGEDRLRLLAELAGQVAYDLDPASGHICWEGAIAQLTGYTAKDLQGVDAEAWQTMIHPDDRLARAKALAQAEEERCSYDVEYRVRGKNGSYRRVEDRGVFLHDESGRVARVLGSLMDVSRRWELEQQLVQAQKMEAVGQLAGGVAHDFNNIVGIIMCYAEQALRHGPNAPESGALKQILKASGRAAALTRQLLAFSRKEIPSPVVVNLNGLLKDDQTMLRRLIGEDIALEIKLDPELENVVVDPGQIEQVLMNLAANARDAMPGGGRLMLKTANVRMETDEGDPSAMTGRVLLQVTDTGHGMQPEVVRHIFEPFFTTKPEGRGTGLGLATVNGIVQQGGGAICVESAVGVGTTFSIYFPPAVQESRVAVAPPRAARTGGTETILLVEDEAALLEILKETLEHQGYTVLAAPGGQQALDLARRCEGTIDLVVTDVVMPGMSGYELVSQLVVERPGLRVLYVSGYTADFIARKGLRIEETDLLPKPFAEDVLQERIRALLDRRSVTNGGPCAA